MYAKDVKSKLLVLVLELATTIKCQARNQPAGSEEVEQHQLVECLEVKESGTGRDEVDRSHELEENSTEGQTQEECVPRDCWDGMGEI